eukprot:2720254-Pyramimonas_sp.AAC.1
MANPSPGKPGSYAPPNVAEDHRAIAHHLLPVHEHPEDRGAVDAWREGKQLHIAYTLGAPRGYPGSCAGPPRPGAWS